MDGEHHKRVPPKPLSRVPAFLEDHMTRHAMYVKQYEAVMTNWLKVHAAIQKLPATEESLRTLCGMMVAEYHHRAPSNVKRTVPRVDILLRLHRRYNVLRAEIERAQMGVKT